MTLPQTIVLLALSRGAQPPFIPPIVRKRLLEKKWIMRAAGGFTITDAGRAALLESEHRDVADRKLSHAQPVWSRP